MLAWLGLLAAAQVLEWSQRSFLHASGPTEPTELFVPWHEKAGAAACGVDACPAMREAAYDIWGIQALLPDRLPRGLVSTCREAFSPSLVPFGNTSEFKLTIVPTQPMMQADEIELFRRTVSNASVYFEFGSGGSTGLVLSQPRIRSVVSVESSWQWSAALVNTLPPTGRDKLTLMFVNVGPVGNVGTPLNNSCRQLFPRYPLAFAAAHPDTDTVLVDGRFRVACTLSVLLSGRRPVVIIHDYFDRPHYHLVQDFMELLDSTRTLAVFRPLPNQDTAKLRALFETYQYDPR